MKSQPVIDTQPKVSDEVRQTTCYMCACRCGINAHLKDGDIRYIEGNRYHPLTPWVYLAISVCGGLIALNAWEQVIVGQSSLIEITTIGLVIAFGVKLVWCKLAGN